MSAAPSAGSTTGRTKPRPAKIGMPTAKSTSRSSVMASARDGSLASRISSGTASPVTRSLTLASLPAVDLDAFVAAHQADWDRLDTLARRRGRLSGPEADELVALYRVALTHLSVVRSAAPDPALLAKL